MTTCDILGCFNEIEDIETPDYCAACDLLLCNECSSEHLCWDGQTEEG